MGLDEGVPERAKRGQGNSAAEGGASSGEAAGAVAKKSDVPADPPKEQKKPAAEGVVPSGNAPGAVVGRKSDVPPDLKAISPPSKVSEEARCGWDCPMWRGDRCGGWIEDSGSEGVEDDRC